MARHPNRLLARLPKEVFSSIEPHLESVELLHGEVLTQAGSPAQQVWFPHSGVISLVVELQTGNMVETAMVGRAGAFNAASALGGKISFNKAIVQQAGTASIIEVDRLRAFALKHDDFRSHLMQHEQVLFAQSQQSAACNASHALEERMCRWLLQVRDFSESNDLVFMQGVLAQMLGVQRPSVSLIASTLQKAGLIRYRRGHAHLLDIDGLQDGSCECYAAVKAHYDSIRSRK